MNVAIELGRLSIKRAADDTINSKGGKKTIIDAEAAEDADFITYPEDVPGSTCANCKFNKKGICQHRKLKKQPVNDRNCCRYWDAPGTLRDWK